MPRGGKRKNAGRPKGSRNKVKRESTKVIRVPVSLLDKIRIIINNWKDDENKTKKIN
jgi:hypothetical protein